jgi:hypothetical protein
MNKNGGSMCKKVGTPRQRGTAIVRYKVNQLHLRETLDESGGSITRDSVNAV